MVRLGQNRGCRTDLGTSTRFPYSWSVHRGIRSRKREPDPNDLLELSCRLIKKKGNWEYSYVLYWGKVPSFLISLDGSLILDQFIGGSDQERGNLIQMASWSFHVDWSRTRETESTYMDCIGARFPHSWSVYMVPSYLISPTRDLIRNQGIMDSKNPAWTLGLGVPSIGRV